MRTHTVIYIKWKITNRIEIFVNLGKLFSIYSGTQLGVSRSTLNRKNLFEGYENDTIEVRKYYIN